MQRIFYNANFYDADNVAEAMLVNDDVIVFMGSNSEVLKMKNDETELVDMHKKNIVPTFFDSVSTIYRKIENGLKNAKKEQFIEKSDIEDENYEKFCNFKIYKQEFLKIQNELLSIGITTIQEMIYSKEEFVFWKKLSEENDLLIDVIGYIDFVRCKEVMDNNCRSFRKYKNHFRLGGYHISLDGLLLESKAYLTKRYPKEKRYKGFLELGTEQLKFIIKTALEEKKQLIIFANGDGAVQEFIYSYIEQIKDMKVEDNFRPVIVGANFISKKQLIKLNELKIAVCFRIDEIIENYENLKQIFNRKIKKIIPLQFCKNCETNYMFCMANGFDAIKLYKFLLGENKIKTKTFCKKELIDRISLIKHLTTIPAFYAFDLENKSTFETGKKANFLVLNKNLDENGSSIEYVYLNGEKIFDCNKSGTKK